MKKYLLLLIIIFITGCASNSSVSNQNTITNKKINYQYSQPWDKEMFDNFYNNKLSPTSALSTIKGGIIPHHLLAGKYIASFLATLEKQEPSVVVLIGPNHFGQGRGEVISTLWDWQTPYGILKTNKILLNKLHAEKFLTFENSLFKTEHSINGPIALIKKILPNTTILPIVLKNNLSNKELDNFANKLKEILPSDAVIISSIDFSHYQTINAANFHDEFSESVIASFDYARLKTLEIDSVPSLYLLLKLMDSYGTKKIVYDWHSNSAEITGQSDLEQTTSYYLPLFSKGESSTEKVASLLFFGDMMLDRNVAKRIGEKGSDYIFSKLAGEEDRFLKGSDIIHVNLEGPFANYRRPTTKEIAFQFNPELISTLKKYNFNLFSIANNHTLDMGSAGLSESKENLTNAGLEFYGDGYDIGSNAVLIKEIGGIKIGFVGFNDTYFPLSEEKIVNKIKEAKLQSDLVVVNIHWGAEYKVLKSNQRQQFLAHLMIDNGADIIIGHHPHVVQEMEIYNNKPIFYSLGNFVFDQYFSKETQEELGVGVIFKKDLQKSLSIYLFPLQSVNSQISQMPSENGKIWFKNFVDSSRLNGYNFDINKHLNLIYEK